MKKLSDVQELDQLGWKIISNLQENARISFAELGRRVGLSTPAVVERVRRMEEQGIIRGYHAEIDPDKVGAGVLAFVGVNIDGDKFPAFIKAAKARPEVLECHRVTGSESFIIKIVVTDIQHLERVIDSLMPYVATTTSMILSSPITWSPISLPRTDSGLLATNSGACRSRE